MDIDKIEAGDKVIVFFGDADESILTGTVLYSPCATGDSWRIRTDEGDLHYVQKFESMTLTEKAEA